MKKKFFKQAGADSAGAQKGRTEAEDTALTGAAPAENNIPADPAPQRSLRIAPERYLP